MTAQREIVGIQYLRGIAACAVVLDHATGMAAFPKYFGDMAFDGMLLHGARGVDLFFMISGFIIAVVSLSKSTLKPKISKTEFIRRRALRILPLMWVAILSYAALRLVGRADFQPIPYIRALFLWPVGEMAPNIIWTLRHEAIFYALFAATFLSSRNALRLLMPFWAIAPLIYSISPSIQNPNINDWIRAFFHPVNIEFSAGLAIGLVWLKWTHHFKFEFKPLLITSIVIFPVTIITCHSISKLLPNYLTTSILSIGLTPLALLAIHSIDKPSKIGLLLGNASFSIYLFHSHALSAMLGIWSKFQHNTPTEIVVPLLSLAAVAAGVVIHTMLEIPLQKATSRLGKGAG